MYIRKLRNKWQCIVRIKNIALTQSFISKALELKQKPGSKRLCREWSRVGIWLMVQFMELIKSLHTCP